MTIQNCLALCIVFFSLLTLAFPGSVSANQAVLIVCGSGGEPEYEERFAEWGERLQTVFISQLSFGEDQVTLLSERPDDPRMISSLMNIEREIQSIIQSKSEIETLWVFLIGHGSFFAQQAKFHTPGLDLTAQQLNEWLSGVNVKHTVIINASSSSAGFIKDLSGPGRILCTATKSVSEKNATEFMRFFLEGVESGAAERDFDERISLLEAASRAAELTQAWYDAERLLATEHALLDDNGDKLGVRLPIESAKSPEQDGYLAAQCFLKEFSFPENAPIELVQEYRAVMDEIVSLKTKKTTMAEEDYYTKLEQLLISAASTNRQIKQF